MKITHTLMASDLVNDGTPTRAAVARCSIEIASSLADAFPDAEIKVDVVWRTHGSVRTQFDWEPSQEEEDRAAWASNFAWERWCETLTDSDYEQIVRCDFGEIWDGPPCESDPAPACDMVEVRWIPDDQKGTHAVAPVPATRGYLCPGCAEYIIANRDDDSEIEFTLTRREA